ncbi:TonB-dependent receptor [Porticoccus sp. W117]|uniref:TonB-dependent receptor plug domain-containing protein n=1 Tax=Porticoccus sp. W117 TaxID=3054777 RepID=UPI002591F75A|nr:TonB-dependent receptor [Porticoccus sp. W117]MDM3870140.1 TonB-dependent receptor [Porticoccus sp. W117]
MKKHTLHLRPISAAVIAAASALSALPTYAEEERVIEEEIISTGTRRAGTLPTETLSPVDVVGGKDIAQQASFDVTDSLSKVTPSLNTQRFPIADGTSFIRPVTLRNLSPDQTLVLVNGTRRHRSALVNLQLAPVGTINQGAQAVDFSALPSAAIKRVEILRDGASAQYGSDAIAGVVNVILNDADEGFTVSSQYGSYTRGDGGRLSTSVNGGFALGENGFLNATLEYSSSNTTSRGEARPDAEQVAGVVGAENTPFNGLGQRWGDPDVDALKLFLNAGVDLSEDTELYGNLSFMKNETVSGFFYRGPVLDPSEQFNARTTLQIDNDGDFLPDEAPQSLLDSITAAGFNVADFLVPVGDVPGATSATGFVLRNPIFSQFPGGYNPSFGADLDDYAIVFGGRGETDGGLSWDIRGRFAENEVSYVISDTINPSLGGLSPTSFNPGTLTQEEYSLNADFVQEVEAGLASPLSIGYGAEIRNETYEIGLGDLESRQAGPTAAIFGVGSDGFQGFPDDSAGSFSSDSFAAYVDFEADLTERFSAGLAVRYEDFDEFGSTTDWKVSGRLEVTEKLALRATANTGFRAPTPGQVNTLNVTTAADANGNLIPNGTFPVNSTVAQVLGAVPLTPEESESFTIGLVYDSGENTTVTLDYYKIDIDDRLGLQNNMVTAADVTALTNAGVPNAALLLGSNANFFSNAFDSETTGADLAITSSYELSGGEVIVDLRHSWNQQDIVQVDANTIDGSRVFDLENQVPNNNTVLTLNYADGESFSGLLRFNRYGRWDSTGGLFGPGDGSDGAGYSGETLIDIEATWNFGEDTEYTVTIGGDNILDTMPDPEQNGVLQFLGVRQSLTSPFGFNGSFWYLRASASF